MVVDQDGAHPALAVAADLRRRSAGSTLRRCWSPGGCGEPAKLFAVAWSQGTGAALLVDGVDIGAPRTVLRDAPTEVPAPPNEAPPAPPGGVG